MVVAYLLAFFCLFIADGCGVSCVSTVVVVVVVVVVNGVAVLRLVGFVVAMVTVV